MIAESRTLTFSREDLVEAALAFARRRDLLPEGELIAVDVEGDPAPEVVIRLQQQDRIFESRVRLGGAQLAAAMIRFCIARHIPIPRKARKETRHVPGGVALVITIEPAPPTVRPLVVPHAAA